MRLLADRRQTQVRRGVPDPSVSVPAPPRDGARPSLRLRRFGSDRSGSIALIFSLVMPALLLVGIGAIELNQVLADKRRTQDVADSAALMGAGQLGVSPYGAPQRAQAFALAQLADVAGHANVTVQASASGQNMTVSVDTQRMSFFGNFLPPGGFHTHVFSTATGVNSAPLCVLTIASNDHDQMQLQHAGTLQAGQCLVHSNSSIATEAATTLQASSTETSTAPTGLGTISPAASVGAPSISDPFSSLSVNANCSGSGSATAITSSTTLTPQTFLGPVNINGGAVNTGLAGVSGASMTVTLAPGEYYFCKGLKLNNAVTLKGSDVVLVFANGSSLNFNGAVPPVSVAGVSVATVTGPTLSLSGRQSGPLAGFAIIADRTYTGNFQLQSDYITGLTGTVYVPTATLQITGTTLSGASSPWTVLAAEATQLDGAQLVVNANYTASPVPVPIGVGFNRQVAASHLTQ